MNDFNDVKAYYTINDAWHDLNLGGAPDKSCRCPWREDRSPSFSVYDEGKRFKDFATGDAGDVADFVALVLHCNLKDALTWCRERLNPNFKTDLSRLPRPIARKDEDRRELILPTANPGEKLEWETVARLRGIHPYALEMAAKIDALLFGSVCSFPSWILHEPGKIAEARRMDGELFPQIGRLSKRKAHTLAGSRKDWPLGTRLLEPSSMALIVEGGPDWLAALHFIALRKAYGCVPVAMMGRSNHISAEAITIFQGRRVRIYPHNDPDGGGLDAARRWGAQLREVGCEVDAFTFDGLVRADGRPVNDLNDAVAINPKDQFKLEALLP